MTISRNVYNQLFEQAADAAEGAAKEKVIRLRPTEAKAGAVVMSAKSKIQMWTKEEHERFLAALEKFPAGPWKKVADFIGTKTPRQTMTHAQKYRQKIHRRARGLRNQKKNSDEANPAPVDTKAAVKGEPKTIVSPYGVADLQLKPGSVAAAAAAAGATSDQLLNILAQQATTIQDKPEPMEVDSEAAKVEEPEKPEEAAAAAAADASMSDAADATAVDQESPNNNLPSLAEILHLSGEGQATAEQAQSPKKEESETDQKTEVETDKKTEGEADEKVKAEKETGSEVDTKTDASAADAKPEAEPQTTRPEECKCNCKCSAHGGQKPALEETTTQPRPDESEMRIA